MGRDKRKVFGIGMFKTGTTAFGEAMRLLGYRSRCRFIPLLDNLSAYFDLDPRQFMPFEDQIKQALLDRCQPLLEPPPS